MALANAGAGFRAIRGLRALPVALALMGGGWGQNGQNGPNPGWDGPGMAGSDFGVLWPRFHWEAAALSSLRLPPRPPGPGRAGDPL